MQSHKRLVVVLVCLCSLSGVLHAQGIPGYTLQEIVIVPVTGAAVSSQTTLVQGVSYKLRAMGWATMNVPGFLWSAYPQGDAEYAFGENSLFFSGSINNCGFFSNGTDIGLAVNDSSDGTHKNPFWGAFTSTHVYTTDFTGLGAPISINYHNCTYAGSQGVITVQIFRPMFMTFTSNAPPGYTDVSPSYDTFAWSTQHSVTGRANAMAASADGTRLYAGAFAGVWRSDDKGLTWRQMTRPQPDASVDAVPGALFVPDVYDIVMTPGNPDIVMVGVASDLHNTAMNGIYRSEDGGSTWNLVKQFTCSSGGQVPQIIFAPDNPNLVYAAGGCAIGTSGDGGKTWKERKLAAWRIAVAPFEQPVNAPIAARVVGGIITGTLGVRRVYALGSSTMFYSTDGGQNWTQDTGISSVTGGFGGGAAPNSGSSSRVLAIEPGNNQHVFLAAAGQANGPSYYVKHQCGVPNSSPEIPDGTTCNTDGRGCGEGSIWLGDFTGFVPFNPAQQKANWTQLPGPPVYWGVTSPSGNTYLDAKQLGSSYLLFFADMSHVHVSAGLPIAGGWHRVEGTDASQTIPQNANDPYCNNVLVHADPHAMAITSDFSMTLQGVPASTPAPYNQNTIAGPNSSGDIWLANDGGVYHANGALPNWRPASGLSTLATINVAGLAAKGFAPALYFGTGDNDDFYSPDGGSTWKNPQWDCGDCDAWFTDPALTREVATFVPRVPGGGFFVYTNATKYPDPEPNPPDGTLRAQFVCPSACNASSSFWDRGFRPMILTPAGTAAAANGDYLVIGTKSDGTRVIFRKTNTVPIATPADWEDPSKAAQYGPNLPICAGIPNCVDIVQASGGHAAPVLYAGDPAAGPNDSRSHSLMLWKWAPGMANWQQIVPSPKGTPSGKTATHANRFYVNPYNPNTIYLLDDAAMKRSDDGGITWVVDGSLDNAVTEHHRYSYNGDLAVVKDVVFAWGEKNTRFAVGNAGVFFTLNGSNWTRLLSTSALPSHPVSVYFDGISDPCDRALYVGLAGRGILRIDPIPSPAILGITGIRPCAESVVNEPNR